MSAELRTGVFTFLVDWGVGPDVAGRGCEERGFESLFLPEHTHIPVSRRSTAPAVSGGEPLPEFYRRMLDPYVSLSAVAASTSRLKIATGVCLLAQHDPLIVAKQVATLDLLSRGRLLFGVGFGWCSEELRHHGVAFDERRAVVMHKLAAVRELWSNDIASYSCQFFSFEASWSWPKPHQEGGPPVLLGGGPGSRFFRFAARYADGWLAVLPIGAQNIRDTLGLGRLEQALSHEDRDPNAFRISLICQELPSNGVIADAQEESMVDRLLIAIPPASQIHWLSSLDEIRDWTINNKLRLEV